jgi:hypothetical protein
MTQLQFWLFLAVMFAFYGRTPAHNRLERIGNWVGKILAVVCVINAIFCVGGVRIFGHTFNFPG